MIPSIHPRLFIDNTKIKRDVTIKFHDDDDDDDDNDNCFMKWLIDETR